MFIKEALLWRRLSSRNVVKILGVCETPISTMTEYLELSFVPFGRDIKKFLQKNFQTCLIGISKDIVSNVINAVCYLHQNDIVRRHIKLSNVLVNNHYYSSLKTSRFNGVFEEETLICKLRDLDEARSAFAQVCMITGNTITSFVTRRKERSHYIYF